MFYPRTGFIVIDRTVRSFGTIVLAVIPSVDVSQSQFLAEFVDDIFHTVIGFGSVPLVTQ